jgi:hypothetical protein
MSATVLQFPTWRVRRPNRLVFAAFREEHALVVAERRLLGACTAICLAGFAALQMLI